MSSNKTFFLSFMLFLVSACSSDTFISHNGNMPSDDKISEIKVGNTQDFVLQTLGSPSSVVALDKDTWIYMSSEIKQIAFMKPEEISRQVLTIKFDNTQKVAQIERLGKANGTELLVNPEQTANVEQEQGFFRKYFGGVGQYSPFGAGTPSL